MGKHQKAACYSRISSDRNQRNIGVDQQRRDCETLCAQRQWEVVDHYVDNDRTAAKRRSERPEYDRMMDDVRAGKVGAVVVTSTDRLQRHPGSLEEFLEVCNQSNLTVLISVRSGEFDLTDPNAIYRLRDDVNRSAWEVETMRQRMEVRQADMAGRGVPHGGGKRGFGWDRDGSTIRDPEAVLIREAATGVLSGETLRSIADDWSRRNVKTVSGRPWTVNSVKATLRNPRNTGLRQHRGEVVGEASWPAIIDRQTWTQLQVIFDSPSRRPRSAPRGYPLRGVVLCGECGKALVAVPRKRPIPSNPERRQRYYGCRKEHGGCGKIFVAGEHVESLVFGQLLSFVDNPRVRQMAQTERDVDDEQIRTLVNENAEDEKKLAELEDAFSTGDLSRTGLQRNGRIVRERIEERQRRLLTLRGTSALDRFGGRVSEHWDDLTADEKRTVTRSLIQSITIKPAGRGGFNKFQPERVEIAWRYDALAQWSEDWDQALTDDERADESAGIAQDEHGHTYEMTFA